MVEWWSAAYSLLHTLRPSFLNAKFSLSWKEDVGPMSCVASLEASVHYYWTGFTSHPPHPAFAPLAFSASPFPMCLDTSSWAVRLTLIVEGVGRPLSLQWLCRPLNHTETIYLWVNELRRVWQQESTRLENILVNSGFSLAVTHNHQI